MSDTPTPINRKHYRPALATGGNSTAGATMSRGHILDEVVGTFFGPGQSPDVCRSYAAPTDWPAAGSLLRVPQVAWLSTFLHDIYANPLAAEHASVGTSGPYYSKFRDPNPPSGTAWEAISSYGILNSSGSVTNGIASGFGLNDGHLAYTYTPNGADAPVGVNTGPGAPDRPIVKTVTNPYPAEFNRLRGVFQAAKERVEALRPGRTWVEVPDYFDHNPATGHLDQNYFQPFYMAPYIYMLSPRTTDSYFGTDFLHVYAGDPYTVTGLAGDGNFTDLEALNNFDPAWASGWPWLHYAMTSGDENRNRFRGFAVRLFGLPSPTDDARGTVGAGGPDVPRIPTVPHQTFIRGPKPSATVQAIYFTHEDDDFLLEHGTLHTYAFNPWSPYPATLTQFDCGVPVNDPPPDHTCYDLAAADARAQAGLDESVALFNATVREQQAFIDEQARLKLNMLRTHAQVMRDNGVDADFSGGTGAITVDSLVALIGEHFGFDPDTGADL